jgi:hypothetical protein
MTQRDAFLADLDKFNRLFRDHGALIRFDDGTQGVDPTKVGAGALDAYTGTRAVRLRQWSAQ